MTWVEFFNGLEPFGRFLSSVGLPVFLILAGVAMVGGFLWKGLPWIAAIIRELVTAFTSFLGRMASANEDMSQALAKLAAHTEQHSVQMAHLPDMHKSVERIETGMDALTRKHLA